MVYSPQDAAPTRSTFDCIGVRLPAAPSSRLYINFQPLSSGLGAQFSHSIFDLGSSTTMLHTCDWLHLGDLTLTSTIMPGCRAPIPSKTKSIGAVFCIRRRSIKTEKIVDTEWTLSKCKQLQRRSHNSTTSPFHDAAARPDHPPRAQRDAAPL